MPVFRAGRLQTHLCGSGRAAGRTSASTLRCCRTRRTCRTCRTDTSQRLFAIAAGPETGTRLSAMQVPRAPCITGAATRSAGETLICTARKHHAEVKNPVGTVFIVFIVFIVFMIRGGSFFSPKRSAALARPSRGHTAEKQRGAGEKKNALAVAFPPPLPNTFAERL